MKRQLDLAGAHLSTSTVDEMLASDSNEIFYRQVTAIFKNIIFRLIPFLWPRKWL